MSDRTFLQHDGTPIKNPQERAAMQVLEARLDGIAADVSEIKVELRTVASGMERVIRLEEGRNQHAEALSRAFEKIHDHEKRLIQVENDLPLTRLVRGWVVAGVVGVAAVVGMQVIGMAMYLSQPPSKAPTHANTER